MIHEYKTTRSICGFVEFLAWLGVGLCVISLLITFGTMVSVEDGVLAIIALGPTLLALLICLMVVIIVQSSRALLDNSVASQKAVIQSAKQHEELMRSFKTLVLHQTSLSERISRAGGGAGAAAVASRAGAVTTAATGDGSGQLEYRGHVIQRDGNKLRVGDRRFAALDHAHAYLDELLGDGPSIGVPAIPTAAPEERREPVLTRPAGLG